MKMMGRSHAMAVLVGLALVSLPARAEESSGDLFSGLPALVQLVCLFVLIALSAVFCGLTLGIMGLDTISLEIIAEAGQEPDRTFASDILPIRKLGHQSLSTLILGNMLANVLIAQLVADLTPPGGSAAIISFVVATIVILIFAEVLPMSICRGPHALEIAAAGVPILRVFLVLLYPVAKPLGMLLDLLTPHDAGQIYDRNELKKLMRIHCETHGDRSGLEMTELKLMIGAMEFHEGVVGHIMTPLAVAFMLEDTTPVERSLVEQLWKEGKSRVPVYHERRENIVGVLFVKDLISQLAFRMPPQRASSGEQNMFGGITVGSLLSSNGRELSRVTASMKLPQVLRMFQAGTSHLLLVESDDATHAAGRKTYVGLVTIEDLIEELIKGEILDEYDNESTDEDTVVPMESSPAAASPADYVYRGGDKPKILAAAAAATGMSFADGNVAHNSSFVMVPQGAAALSTAVPSSGGGGSADAGTVALTTRRVLLPKPPKKMPRINFCSFYPTGTPLSHDHKWVLAEYLQTNMLTFLGWKLSFVKLLLDEVGDREVTVSATRRGLAELVHADGSVSDDLAASQLDRDISLASSLSSCESTVSMKAFVKRMCSGTQGHEALAARIPSDLLLYVHGQPSSTFTMVLSGGVRVIVGDEMFSQERGTFSTFGECLLNPKSVGASSASESGDEFVSPPAPTVSGSFTPDFTAIVSRTSRLLQITRADVLRVEGYMMQRTKRAVGRSFALPHLPVSDAAPPRDTRMMTEEPRAAPE